MKHVAKVHEKRRRHTKDQDFISGFDSSELLCTFCIPGIQPDIVPKQGSHQRSTDNCKFQKRSRVDWAIDTTHCSKIDFPCEFTTPKRGQMLCKPVCFFDDYYFSKTVQTIFGKQRTLSGYNCSGSCFPLTVPVTKSCDNFVIFAATCNYWF